MPRREGPVAPCKRTKTAPRFPVIVPSSTLSDARRPELIADFPPGSTVQRPGTVPVPTPWIPDPDDGPTETGTSTGRSTLRRTLSLSSLEGMAGELVAATAGGAVLVGWALHLGSSPLIVAFLGALPFIAQIFQFPSAWLTSALGSRRVAIWGLGLGRLLPAALAAFPWLPVDPATKRWILIAVATLSSCLTAMGSNGWTAWMGDLVPSQLRGRYFGKRLSLVTISGATGALAAGLLLDAAVRAGTREMALALLACVAGAAGAMTVVLLLRHRAPPARTSTRRFDVAAAIAALRDPSSRPYLRYQLAWNASIGVSSAFFAVHMLQNLKMGFALVAVHGAATATIRVLIAPLWGRLVDRFGARPILVVCSFGLFLVPLIWLLPTRNAFLLPLALDVFVAGGLWAGHALASFELPLAVAPVQRRPYYLAAFSTAGGVAFAVASVAGGWLAQHAPTHVVLAGKPLLAIHLLFLLSAAGRLLSAPLSLRLREPGASSMEEFFQAIGDRLQSRGARLARAFAGR